MKKRLQNSHRKAQEYWKRLMHSTQNNISRGASNIHRIISWARNENWRRREKKK